MGSTLKWFMALNEDSASFKAYADMAKVAVESARRHTDLAPHFLYDGQDNEFTAWMQARGVRLIRVRTRFYDALAELAQRTGRKQVLSIGPGAFLRTDLPLLAPAHGIHDEFVLYTDCDVMFTGEVTSLSEQRPKLFSVAPQADPADYVAMNTGVMVMNLPAMARDDAEFQRFTLKRLEEFSKTSWDQMAYRQFYGTAAHGKFAWDRLDPEFNWKPYWGVSSDARIVHFHGPKPHHLASVREGKIPSGLKSYVGGGYEAYSDQWHAAMDLARAS